MRTLDVNCDMGESFGNWSMGADEAMMPHITTANVACGFHGGDPLTMRKTIRLAAEHGVAIGAHPGFPDLLGFGRRALALDGDDAAAYVTYQAGALQAFLAAEGLPLHHVKPHGAFFSVLRDDARLAEPVADAVAALGDGVLVYWPAPAEGVPFCDALAARGVQIVGEIYPDLSYDAGGKLKIQRTKAHTDVDFAAGQVRSFLADGTVAAEDGSKLGFEARSACVHGDGPNAVEVAEAIERAVAEAGASLAAVNAA
jgi:5-oxoprolinase (ATP-hydrolysing) subunit A